MEQESKSIYDFKKGDKITRLKPFVDETGRKDFSLAGNDLTFLGIANSCVYLSKKADSIIFIFLGDKEIPIRIPLELCEQGWGYYADPEFLPGPEDLEKGIDYSPIARLEREKEEAIKDQDYEKADEITKKIDKLKNKGKKPINKR